MGGGGAPAPLRVPAPGPGSPGRDPSRWRPRGAAAKAPRQRRPQLAQEGAMRREDVRRRAAGAHSPQRPRAPQAVAAAQPRGRRRVASGRGRRIKFPGREDTPIPPRFVWKVARAHGSGGPGAAAPQPAGRCRSPCVGWAHSGFLRHPGGASGWVLAEREKSVSALQGQRCWSCCRRREKNAEREACSFLVKAAYLSVKHTLIARMSLSTFLNLSIK